MVSTGQEAAAHCSRSLSSLCDNRLRREVVTDRLVGVLETLPDHDLVDFAEAVGGSRDLSALFAEVVEEGGEIPGMVVRIVIDCLKLVGERRARTRFGRKVKLDQAIRVFSLLERKASSYASLSELDGESSIPARNQAAWCAAMQEGIRVWA
jgi:hypothetical protein